MVLYVTRPRRDEVRIGRGLPSVKIYIHPAETHRLLKFLFHIMGRLVPAHNKRIIMGAIFTNIRFFLLAYAKNTT